MLIVEDEIVKTTLQNPEKEVEESVKKKNYFSSQPFSLRAVSETIETLVYTSEDIEKVIRKCQMDLRVKWTKGLHLSTIFDHFRNEQRSSLKHQS